MESDTTMIKTGIIIKNEYKMKTQNHFMMLETTGELAKWHEF